MSDVLPDWTEGTARLAYQRCAACGGVQYFRRAFCAACGATELDVCAASGRGLVHAVSVVHRAASAEARALVPYAIVLIDAEEGFRLMAHGEVSLAIGDRVSIGFRRFLDHLVPYAERTAA